MHAHTQIGLPLHIALSDCLFGYRKRARACVYLIVHKREVTQALNLGVCHHSVWAVHVHRSFFSIRLRLLLFLGRNNIHQQEGRGTDNELNRGFLPCWTEVPGNRFRLKIGYQMTNWTMFLCESLWELMFSFFPPSISIGKRSLCLGSFNSQSGPDCGLDVGWVGL